MMEPAHSMSDADIDLMEARARLLARSAEVNAVSMEMETGHAYSASFIEDWLNWREFDDEEENEEQAWKDRQVKPRNFIQFILYGTERDTL